MTSDHDARTGEASAKESDAAIVRARLAAIVDSSHDAILAKSLDGTITAWNPAAEQLYGYTAAEIIGRSVETIIPPELRGESDHILSEVLAGRSVLPYDTERITRAGARVSVSIAVSPIRDANGAVVGASTIARDISARLAADAERAWNATLVRQSADAIIALDANGLISTWNPAAEELFGYSSAEAIGRLPHHVVAADDDDSVRIEISESVLTEGRTRRYEAKRKHRNGDELSVQISIARLDAPDGTTTGAVVSIRDVTEARNAEAQIQAAQTRESQLVRELEQTRRLESVGQLAGGIAHDFNNLLSVILNLAAFVASSLPDGVQARADAEEIGQTARRAANLTRQLLIFSRRDIVEPEVFNAGELIAGLQSFLARALGEQVTFDATCEAELLNVRMDRGQLEQVVVNLAINGRDAMPRGGRLMIETRNTLVDAEFAQSRVGLTPGPYVTVTVSDTGVGMPRDVIERAFEPFFTTKPEGKGTGLGLATVYGIVANAGGHVALYSEPGHGTTVHVHLPAVDAAPSHLSRAVADTKPGAGQRILIVEDAADVRNISERILQQAGYDVVAVGSAAEALAAVTGSDAGPAPIQLLLTDVVMSSSNGPELAATLRRADPNMKVLYMSGYSDQMLTDDVLGHPQSAFVEKPFAAEHLRAKVSELLQRD